MSNFGVAKQIGMEPQDLLSTRKTWRRTGHRERARERRGGGTHTVCGLVRTKTNIVKERSGSSFQTLNRAID